MAGTLWFGASQPRADSMRIIPLPFWVNSQDQQDTKGSGLDCPATFRFSQMSKASTVQQPSKNSKNSTSKKRKKQKPKKKFENTLAAQFEKADVRDTFTGEW